MAGFFALREKGIVQVLQFAHERLWLMIKPSSMVALQQRIGLGLTQRPCGVIVALGVWIGPRLCSDGQ